MPPPDHLLFPRDDPDIGELSNIPTPMRSRRRRPVAYDPKQDIKPEDFKGLVR